MQEVPLWRELEFLALYLSIEEVRFQDRMRVEITADPGALDAAVPHLGLQPIVENAIRHGIGRSSAAGRIRIHAACSTGCCGLKCATMVRACRRRRLREAAASGWPIHAPAWPSFMGTGRVSCWKMGKRVAL